MQYKVLNEKGIKHFLKNLPFAYKKDEIKLDEIKNIKFSLTDYKVDFLCLPIIEFSDEYVIRFEDKHFNIIDIEDDCEDGFLYDF